LRDDKKFAKLKEEEKISTLQEEEKIFASKMEDNKGIKMEKDHKVKIIVGDLLSNDSQVPTILLKENAASEIEVILYV